MVEYSYVKQEVEKLLGNKQLEDLSTEDYDRLLDEVFYSRLSNKPSEKIEGTEVSLTNTELLSTSPAYRDKSKFSLIDNDSTVVVNVSGDRLSNDNALQFVLPFKSENDKMNFIALLLYLDEISKIKYPEEDIEI